MLRATVVMLCALATPAAAASGPAALGEAFRALESGQYDRALELGKRLDRAHLHNSDYADYVVGQAALLTGDYRLAHQRFGALSRDKSSRFQDVAAWQLADCEWQLGRTQAARKSYLRLIKKEGGKRHPAGDLAVARFRAAEADAVGKQRARAIEGFRAVIRNHPAHPLAARARQRVRELGGERPLSAIERIERAELLTEAHLWREAIHELDQVGDDVPVDVRRRRDFQMGRTLFAMRRQYQLAGELLLSVWPYMGADRAWALFHGARGLSRAHLDEKAIGYYEQVVDEFPRHKLAAEAQYLSGWLQFNLGNYREAIEPLKVMLAKYPRSKWAIWALWYQAMSHYLLGELDAALPLFEKLGDKGGRLEGNKGLYWRARTLQRLGRDADAIAQYRAVVGAHPFSWYALLARSRLAAAGVAIDPFGDSPRDSADAPELAGHPRDALAADALIRRVDELIDAGLPVEAGVELRRGEKPFIKRYGRTEALAVLLDRYRRAGNYNRPWMLAVVYGGNRALDAPPTGRARVWWEHAYPKAYEPLIEKWRDLGDNPKYYLYSIMRKESGFDPHTVSYADALGLLQMIPPTTRRVAAAMDISYTDDLLFDPEMNIRVGSWYIGRLLHKFKDQIPIGSASFNSGPGPVMRWLDANGDRPIDEYVELISFSQAREYGKKVTETYARYLYLYENQVYEQPLELDGDYVVDALTY